MIAFYFLNEPLRGLPRMKNLFFPELRPDSHLDLREKDNKSRRSFGRGDIIKETTFRQSPGRDIFRNSDIHARTALFRVTTETCALVFCSDRSKGLWLRR